MDTNRLQHLQDFKSSRVIIFPIFLPVTGWFQHQGSPSWRSRLVLDLQPQGPLDLRMSVPELWEKVCQGVSGEIRL